MPVVEMKVTCSGFDPRITKFLSKKSVDQRLLASTEGTNKHNHGLLVKIGFCSVQDLAHFSHLWPARPWFANTGASKGDDAIEALESVIRTAGFTAEGHW